MVETTELAGDSARVEELFAVLKPFQGKRLFVAVLGSPDPDGLSSAWAFSLLARQKDIQADILTFEVISRPDNALFATLLGIPFRRVTDKLPRKKYAGYVVVDRQNARLPIRCPLSIPLVAHFDHHVVQRSRALFTHQDPNYGSTASILAEYVAQFLPGWFAEDPELVRRLATALMYGIRTDTQDFLTAGPRDYKSAAVLAPYVAGEWLRTLLRTPLGLDFLRSLGQALKTLEITGGLAVAYAGRVPRTARDSVGQVADFLLNVEAVQTVVVFGVVGDTIVGSLRTTSACISPSAFLAAALGRHFGQAVDCGGRQYSGGFQIPLSPLKEDQARETIFRLLREAWLKQCKKKRR